ncbi:DEAD/DEAH box helicase [Brevibacterium moorei]|uniref:DEAD/DEAH box helicase n=1 Tax=Brevibacterium moorei TaxID=2968457 RepID=UPI00211D10D1|nr:DEAD/DEAH box helicase [Brevibacterium sp. 68QC2CO]MCQ9385743.1 DEAD/DEAH box helicase [Brevibacterium sp. 68QC2CO]
MTAAEVSPPHPTATPLAPGSVVTVRDEDWLVTGIQTVYERASHQDLQPTKPVNRIEVQGLSELVRDTTAIFYDSIDQVTPIDPRQAPLISDDSPGYRNSRLWLEATLMKTAVPVEDTRIRLADGMLIDAKDYQRTPVRKILDPDNLRPRILLADAVGLGKTIEIGLILAELIKRGRGDRILIVTPKHVLEQMQHEMWTKFAIPFVRLDSQGIQRIRQKLPATRNPFTYFKRAIISIDTLKSDRYLAHLRKHQWDAVVIDESHNVTNTSSLNNRLANTLARNTDALILASATPHNGKADSFAELIRLLEPTAVRPDGKLDEDAVKKLVVRRHRYSEDVRKEVSTDWAERKDPQALTATASPEENAVADELDQVWLHPVATAGNPQGKSPYSGNTQLFPWTLAKAFLSSPEALIETVDNRRKIVTGGHPDITPADPAKAHELGALNRLHDLATAAKDAVTSARAAKQPQLGKYGELLKYLKQIKVGPKSAERVVVFAERIATLNALAANIKADLKFKDDQVRILHGGLNDQEQQEIVESFKKKSSPIRVLVTGDVASEGVNLHSQCHELVHFDIPWSLIRIEQRNGRIDRYGQTCSPQITTLVLEPEAQSFSGDIHVLVKLIEKENEAHKALGDAAALMGKYSAKAEEDAIRDALAKGQDVDQVVPDAPDPATDDPMAMFWGGFGAPVVAEAPRPAAAVPASDGAGLDAGSAAQPTATGLSVYQAPIQFLEDGLNMVFHDHPDQKPSADGQGGVGWTTYMGQPIAELTPPRDMLPRLENLPESYLRDRHVKQNFKLVTEKRKGRELVEAARNSTNRKDDSLWPEAHYLGPLHPVLEWVSDRALAAVPRRGGVYAVRGAVDYPTVVIHAGLTNKRGQTVASVFSTVEFPDPDNPAFGLPATFPTIAGLLRELGVTGRRSNPGRIDIGAYQHLIAPAVDAIRENAEAVVQSSTANAQHRVHAWTERNGQWQQTALRMTRSKTRIDRSKAVQGESELIQAMQPDRTLVRPLLLVLPADTPVTTVSQEPRP